MGTLSRVTGFNVVDELIGPIPSLWSVEFYGDELLVNYLFHVTLAYNSSWRRVYVVIARERGGLDPALLVKLCRIHDCSIMDIAVARAFRFEDLVDLLRGLSSLNEELIVVLHPYSYLPRDPGSYWKATMITGLLHNLSLRNQLILFNTVSRFGDYMPEGGSMHHHVVKVIVKLSRKREVCYAKLIKHPGRGVGVRVFRFKLLETPLIPPQRTLLSWAKT